MFINYFNDSTRQSPLNLLVARLTLGFYGLWKIVTIEATELTHLEPEIISIYTYPFIPEIFIKIILPLLPLIILISLSLFVLGYRVKLTALSSGISVFILSILLRFSGLYLSLSTLSHLLLIYGIFGEDDTISFPEFNLQSVKSLRPTKSGQKYNLRFLKWMLVYLSFTYFLIGFNRLISSGLTNWINLTALPRTISHTLALQGKSLTPVAELLISEPLVIILGVTITFLAELGLLAHVLLKKSIDLILITIIGLHILFAVTMNLYSLNQLMLIALLLPYDKLIDKTVNNLERVQS